MKKIVVWVLFLMLVSTVSFAATRGTAEYEKIKEYKKAQRAKEEAIKKDPSLAEKKEPGFWDREAKHSGLGGTPSKMSNFFKNLNPAPFFKEQEEKYNARKAGATQK